MYKLSGEENLPGPAIMDYLAYTTKIYQFVQLCSLVPIFLYDKIYRQLQTNMGFRWVWMSSTSISYIFNRGLRWPIPKGHRIKKKPNQ